MLFWLPTYGGGWYGLFKSCKQFQKCYYYSYNNKCIFTLIFLEVDRSLNSCLIYDKFVGNTTTLHCIVPSIAYYLALHSTFYYPLLCITQYHILHNTFNCIVPLIAYYLVLHSTIYYFILYIAQYYLLHSTLYYRIPCILQNILFFCLVVFFNKRFSFILVILLTFFIDIKLKTCDICMFFNGLSYSFNIL